MIDKLDTRTNNEVTNMLIERVELLTDILNECKCAKHQEAVKKVLGKIEKAEEEAKRNAEAEAEANKDED